LAAQAAIMAGSLRPGGGEERIRGSRSQADDEADP
jgi:hypothetical protein